MQIHEVTVDDANRILKEDYYTYQDRWDAGKSKEMFMVVAKFYAKHYDDWSAEGIARRWNGGPTGHNKQATVAYWQKVKARL